MLLAHKQKADGPRAGLGRSLRCTLAGLALTAAGSSPLLDATPARADATGCNRNVCMYLSTPRDGKVYIEAWADDSCFDGNFDVTGPGGLYIHHGPQRFCPGDRPYPLDRFVDIPAVVGKYCVKGWSNNKVVGNPCENVE